MNKIFAFFLMAGFSGPLSAAETEWFPRSEALFTPRLADPTEPAYALRMGFPVGRSRLGEVNLGDYWALVSKEGARGPKWSLGALGGATFRFDLNTVTSDFLIGDFTGGVPLHLRWNEKWSAQVAYWHTSSHLGDDFLKNTGRVTSKAVTDEIRATGSFRPWKPWRFYGGYGYALKNLPDEDGHRLQGGIEWASGSRFAALDLTALGRAKWNPTLTVRCGLRAKGEGGGGGVFVEYAAGRKPYIQFRREEETKVSLGISFSIGRPAW